MAGNTNTKKSMMTILTVSLGVVIGLWLNDMRVKQGIGTGSDS